MLHLAWKIDKHDTPLPWEHKKPRGALEQDMVCAKPEDIACHTAIIAQSGSGKSFFLGRLLEEILINTKAQMRIFDPNGDFLQFNNHISSVDWKKYNKYDSINRRGFLTHESKVSTFSNKWKKIVFSIHRTKSALDPNNSAHVELSVPIQEISAAFLGRGLSAPEKSALYHAHQFTIAATIVTNEKDKTGGPVKLSYVEDLFEKSKELSRKDFLEYIEKKYLTATGSLKNKKSDDLINLAGSVLGYSIPIFGAVLSSLMENAYKIMLNARLKDSPTKMFESSRYFTDKDLKFYCGEIHKYQAQHLISRKPLVNPEKSADARTQIFDLPSIETTEAKLLVVDALLEKELSKAKLDREAALKSPHDEDTRVPVFIVVDEAHNLIPAEPQNEFERAVRDKFRTIAAEGRKFGLFLILVSQRPDKLDKMVLSECSNRAVMKLSGQSVLDETVSGLALEDVSESLQKRCLNFDKGRMLLYGSWVNNEPVLAYGAARRTIEGGGNLRKSHWAVPYS